MTCNGGCNCKDEVVGYSRFSGYTGMGTPPVMETNGNIVTVIGDEISTMPKLKINIKALSENAIMPKRAKEGDVGYDLYSAEDIVLNPMQCSIVKTDIAVELPNGLEAQIRCRSGLAAKNQIIVVNGVGTVDSGYRGNCGVILMNLGTVPFEIKKGDRIAQMVFNWVALPDLTFVDELSSTDRNAGGFGSTGKI